MKVKVQEPILEIRKDIQYI